MARKRRTIPILLLEDNESLGHVGDVVEVRPGFARNFLLPTGAACAVTQDALRHVERAKERASAERAERVARLASLAEKIEGLRLVLEEKASEEGHLFGSVGVARIVAEMRARGIEVDERQIELEHPFKELGIYDVAVRLDKDRKADVRVWVVESSEA